MFLTIIVARLKLQHQRVLLGHLTLSPICDLMLSGFVMKPVPFENTLILIIE